MSRFQVFAVALTAALVTMFLPFSPIGASGSQASVTPTQQAVAWLESQQRPDGGFELAGSPGFETPDAVLAIAEQAQTSATWNAGQAVAAVRAVRRNGWSALHALDEFADSGLDAGKAAKLIVLDLVPLGLDPTRFDPDCDIGTTNLVSVLDAGLQPSGSYGTFNATLYAALAKKVVSGSVPAQTVTFIRNAQQTTAGASQGGWNFAGDPTKTDLDIDTTSVAIRSMLVAGASVADATVHAGLVFLAKNFQTNGSWQSFAADDPNSTASAVLALAAAGFDITTSTWRDTLNPAAAGSPYTSPDSWLLGHQATDGRIASPNDSFGINTFATSQTIQALLRPTLPSGTGTTVLPCGGYLLDGLGIVHPFAYNGSEIPGAIAHGPVWSWNIARGITVLATHTGGYILDGYGALHPFALGANAPPAPPTTALAYWHAWDIARDVAVLADGTGGFVLDGYGALHPFGLNGHAAPALPTSAVPDWAHWDIARGVALLPDGTGGYIVDGWGGLHPFALKNHGLPALPTPGLPYWNGWDIARKLAITPDGTGGYIVDGWGGLHPVGLNAHAAPTEANAGAPYWRGWDIARGLAL
jgi:hypothetical protein